MVYGAFYLPESLHFSLLSETYHFDDSKILSPEVRSSLLQALCTAGTALYQNCGWASRVISARDIAAGMLAPSTASNLNGQALDATVQLIQGVMAQGINVTTIFVDTVGIPESYQRKLARIFPAQKITVAKKADSLYPCVSAASVCAKVTRDAALEALFAPYAQHSQPAHEPTTGWGSGYPSDGRSIAWLKRNIDPIFGWGNECRFSWGTAKELLENEDLVLKHSWSHPEEEDSVRLDHYFNTASNKQTVTETLAKRYGVSVGRDVL